MELILRLANLLVLTMLAVVVLAILAAAVWPQRGEHAGGGRAYRPRHVYRPRHLAGVGRHHA